MKSILIDSNVIIRIFAQDDIEQVEKSRNLFHKIGEGKVKGVISLLVISEVIWILEKTYLRKKKDILPELLSLFSSKSISILEVSKEYISKSFDLMLTYTIDFTDAYLFVAKQDREIFSFDKDFKKLK